MKKKKKKITTRLDEGRPTELDELQAYLKKKMGLSRFSQNDTVNYLIKTNHQRLARFIKKEVAA